MCLHLAQLGILLENGTKVGMLVPLFFKRLSLLYECSIVFVELVIMCEDQLTRIPHQEPLELEQA